MKLFISHPSFEKSNVKRIIEYLPPVINTWLDERNLGWGDKLSETFERVIKTEMDYVLVFISGDRNTNAWVLKELHWALEHQERINRTFILPIIMPNAGAYFLEEYPEIANLKFIRVYAYDDSSFKTAADTITQHILGLVLNDLERIYNPKDINYAEIMSRASLTVEDVCKTIYAAVFKHRAANPITVDALYNKLTHSITKGLGMQEFCDLLERVTCQISGLYYDGYELYIIEEHSNWKKNIGLKNKQAIAYEASKRIRNGMLIFIDAGSTTTELINIICTRLEARNLAGIKLVVISTEHASKVADYCAKMGYDQYTSPLLLIIPGGVVRPNTKAIVGLDATNDIQHVIREYGKFDLAFIGANGATLKQGIVTNTNEELAIKQTVIANSKNTFFCFDDSKFGIELDSKLADLGQPNIKIITNENPDNEEMNEICERYPNSIVLAKRRHE